MVFILLYICSPLIALPVALYGIKKRIPEAFIVFAMILGTVAYCTIPYQDLYRHLEHYINYSTYNFSDFTAFDFELNGAIVYVYAAMGKLGIPFDFARFFTVTVSFSLLFDIFRYKVKHSQVKYTDKEYFIRFLTFTFFYDLFYTIAGVRYGFALSFYLYGVFLLIERKQFFWSLIFLIIATLFHSSFLYLSIASFSLFAIRLSKRSLIFVIIVSFAAMTIFFTKYSYLLGLRQDWYVSSGNAPSSNDYSSMTFMGFMGFMLPKLCVLPYAYILLKNYNEKNKWMKISMAWMLLSVITIQNPVFFYRIWWGFMAIGIYLYLEIENWKGKNEAMSKKLLYASICFAFFSLFPVHTMLQKSDYYRLIQPANFIFSEQYTEDYIHKVAPEAGDFVNEK